MPYLGNAPAEAYTSTVKNSFNGDASTTAFTLSQPSTTNNLRVVVENVIQDPTVAYSVSGTTLTFTSAPPVGTANIYAVHLGPATQTAVPPSEINNATTYTSDLTVQGDLTVDTNTLHVDAANNRVGVGTASPGEPLDVSGNIRALGANSRVLFGPDGFEAGIKYATDGSFQIASRTGEPITFTNGHDGTEIARIVTGGAFYIGETTAISSGDGQRINLTSGSSGNYIRFKWSGSEYGSITLSGGGIAYNTSSDYRLKENVTELTGAIDRVKQVPVHRFNFITDPDKTVDGFLAHEVADVVPEAITGTKDEVNEDGNPVYQGIDQSKLVPLLTAAIKEQQALIEDLQTRLAALENV